MCRLLALISSQPITPDYELITAEHSLYRQSIHARAPHGFGEHDDGCGMAWRDENHMRLVRRGRDERWDSSFCEEIKQLKSCALIAHNRKASAGLKVDREVSHPYLSTYNGETVAFCHNGGINDLMDEAIERGVSDSVIYMERLLSSADSLSVREVSAFLKSADSWWTYSSLNALLLTNDGILAWRCYQEGDDSSFDKERYCSLYIRQTPDRVCIASEPIDSTEGWVSIPNRTVLHVKHALDGVEVVAAAL